MDTWHAAGFFYDGLLIALEISSELSDFATLEAFKNNPCVFMQQRFDSGSKSAEKDRKELNRMTPILWESASMVSASSESA